MTRFLASVGLFTLLAGSSLARADNCCRYVIEGCGKKANICVPRDCNSNSRSKAKEAFEKENKCSSSNDASYIHTCENEKCDIDLRKK